MTPLHTKTVSLAIAHVPNQGIKVTTANGSIDVGQQSRSDVELTAEIRATTPERLEQVTIQADRDEQGTLVVKTNWPDKRKSREGCSFTIALPDAQGVDLQSSNGSLTVTNLAGGMQLKTSNGSIKAESHRGKVVAETSNGSIKVRDASGDVDLHSSNGKIEGTGIKGSAKAKTSNGNIAIALAPESQGPINAKSSNGSLTLTLNQRFTGELDLSTSNGSVKIDDALESSVVSRHKKKRARLQVGKGGPSSSGSTSNGSIHVEVLR